MYWTLGSEGSNAPGCMRGHAKRVIGRRLETDAGTRLHHPCPGAPEAQAKDIAASAAKTDGIIFHLWPDGAKAPDGTVGHPQAVGHKLRTQ